MKNFKNFIGSIIIYFNILSLGVAMNIPSLAISGLVISPIVIIFFNKIFRMEAKKYYICLATTVLITFSAIGINNNYNINVIEANGNKTASIKNTEKSVPDKEVDKNKDSLKEDTDNEDIEETQIATDELVSDNTNSSEYNPALESNKSTNTNNNYSKNNSTNNNYVNENSNDYNNEDSSDNNSVSNTGDDTYHDNVYDEYDNSPDNIYNDDNNYNDDNTYYDDNNYDNTSDINSGAVYWTPNGKCYHSSEGCFTLSRSKTILSGTIEESGKSGPCEKCY